jgi:hypothetical protein
MVISLLLSRGSLRPLAEARPSGGTCARSNTREIAYDFSRIARIDDFVEIEHQPTRERKRRLRGFKSPGHAQRFLSVCGVIILFSALASIYLRL